MRSGAMYRAVPMSSCSRGPRGARAVPNAVEALVASLPDLARAAFVDAFVQAVAAGEDPALRRVLTTFGAFFRWHAFRWRQGSGQRHQGRERGFVHVVVPRDRELLAEQLA